MRASPSSSASQVTPYWTPYRLPARCGNGVSVAPARAMAPHVSSGPRAAYVNYIDLDLGTVAATAAANRSATAVDRARETWGASYFAENLDRLVRAKTRIDPANVFNNAQSIPPLQRHD